MEYIKPVLELIEFTVEDIITTSLIPEEDELPAQK